MSPDKNVRRAAVPPADKVLDEDNALSVTNRARSQGIKTVMAVGVFDLMHAGELRYLEEAAKKGDRLLVGVFDDEQAQELLGSGRPLEDLRTRMEMLAHLGSVDFVFPLEEPHIRRVLLRLKPDVLAVRPKEHEDCKDLVTSYGGQVKKCGTSSDPQTNEVLDRLNKSGKSA